MQGAHKLHALTMLGALLLASCGDEASVGRDGCYQGIVCQELNGRSLLSANQTSSAIYDRLPATWTHATLGATRITQDLDGLGGLASTGGLGGGGDLSGTGLSALSGVDLSSPLVIGPQNTPWVFVPTGASFAALSVNASGELIAAQSLSPPPGLALIEN